MKFILSVFTSSFPLSFLPFNFSFYFCIKVIHGHSLSSHMIMLLQKKQQSGLWKLPCLFNLETHVSSSRYNLWVTQLPIPPSCRLCLSVQNCCFAGLPGRVLPLSQFFPLPISIFFSFYFTSWEIFSIFSFCLAVGFIISTVAFLIFQRSFLFSEFPFVILFVFCGCNVLSFWRH